MFKKHPIRNTVLILLTLLILAYAATGAVIMMNGNGIEGEFQFLLVLGTTVEGTEPSPMLRDRINAAYDYLTAHPDVVCVVSGYKSGNGLISEAVCMFNELTEMGIDPGRILVEQNASSTLENLEFSLDLIEEKTGSRPDTIGILSSEFHLLRATMFATEYGVNYYTIPAKTSDFPTFLYWFAREIIMVWYYSIF